MVDADPSARAALCAAPRKPPSIVAFSDHGDADRRDALRVLGFDAAFERPASLTEIKTLLARSAVAG